MTQNWTSIIEFNWIFPEIYLLIYIYIYIYIYGAKLDFNFNCGLILCHASAKIF